MYNFPNTLDVLIEWVDVAPNPIKYYQILGTFLTLEIGNSSTYAQYDTRKSTAKTKISEHLTYVKGKAVVHGINCFEVVGTFSGLIDDKSYECVTFERITDTHKQTLAAIEDCYGTKSLQTFKDDDFMKHFAMGEHNCGMAIELMPKGIIISDTPDDFRTDLEAPGTYDVVGTYKLHINGIEFRAIRMIYIAADGQVSDFFIDDDGREIMHRFFVPDQWGMDDKTPILYSERWPHLEIITLNNDKKVCTTYAIPSYIVE